VKDYYLILGVARTEDPGGIRQAFLELAKRYHPDRAGSEATARFQEIQEAYEILSDPDRRRVYNRGLRLREESAAVRAAASAGREGMAVSDFLTVRPSLEALSQRLRRDFTGKGVPKGARPEPLNVEIILSADEGISGGVVPLDVPTFYPCPACDGSGRTWLFLCVDCRGQGLVQGAERVDIWIPPLTREDAIVDVPIPGLVAQNLFLRAHLRIAG
jgi:molecular chaperone DnaJ